MSRGSHHLLELPARLPHIDLKRYVIVLDATCRHTHLSVRNRAAWPVELVEFSFGDERQRVRVREACEPRGGGGRREGKALGGTALEIKLARLLGLVLLHATQGIHPDRQGNVIFLLAIVV